jgi:hypothetical protein
VACAVVDDELVRILATGVVQELDNYVLASSPADASIGPLTMLR